VSPAVAHHSRPDRAVAGTLEQVRAGRPILLVDGSTGVVHLMAAARTVTPEWVAFLVRYSTGFLEVAISSTHARALDLPPMWPTWSSGTRPVHAVSVDAAEGITTGISAADRATTIRLLGSPEAVPGQLRRPGHVVPISVPRGPSAVEGGVPASALQLVYGASVGAGAVLAALVGEGDDADLADVAEAARFAERWELATVRLSEVRAVLGSRPGRL
jgi:3,4-dihydroxy 2-butanone 4-phosphate synthase/GTP cyclohydrolase II